MGVYMRVDQQGWQPGVNTLAYYPLNSTDTVNDLSGNSRTLTNSGVTFGTYQGVDCAIMPGNKYLYNTSSYGLNNGSFTVSIRCYYVRSGGWEQPRFYGDDGGNIGVYTNPSNNKIGYNPKGGQTTASWSTTAWQLATVTYDGSVCKLYVNGVNVDTTSTSSYVYSDNKLGIGGYVPNPEYWYGGLSEFILENKVWTAQEVADYYNQTKSNYGL